jgi:hypothetical protein
MAAAAYLSATVAMLLGIVLVWRMRSDAVEALARAKADARRGRHAQALGADIANITQALVLSVESINRDELSGNNAEAVGGAHASIGSLVQTLRAAQYLLADEARHVEHNAEGWVRVAIAGARGEGVGVRVGGLETSLRVNGRTTDIVRILDDLILGLGATVPPRSFVQVDFAREGIELSAPIAPGRARDPRIARAAAIADLVGWTAVVVADGETTVVRLGGETVAPKRPMMFGDYGDDDEDEGDQDDHEREGS